MKKYETVILDIENKVATVTLNRPEVHNAFNDQMLIELIDVFKELEKDESVRVVVMTGNGKSFCAGADLNWMGSMINYSYEENIEDSNRVSECMYRLYTLPQPTICRANGSAIGGGMGLVSACDIVIAAETAKFSLSEVKIGLVPACISPFVIQKIGVNGAREYFLTGERLTAEKAFRAGLANRVVSFEDMDNAVDELVERLLSSGPQAIAYCKELIRNVPTMDLEEAGTYTAEMIAELRVSDEGQEGIKAFFEKRKPNWMN